VARHGVSIALACRTFVVSETCYSYSPLLSDENEHIIENIEKAQDSATQWLCTYNNGRVDSTTPSH
jgi:putative transposase